MIKALLIINDHYSYAISIVLCSLTIVVIMVLIVGLAIGANGYSKFKKHKQDEISKCGGIILLLLVILIVRIKLIYFHPVGQSV